MLRQVVLGLFVRRMVLVVRKAMLHSSARVAYFTSLLRSLVTQPTFIEI